MLESTLAQNLSKLISIKYPFCCCNLREMEILINLRYNKTLEISKIKNKLEGKFNYI